MSYLKMLEEIGVSPEQVEKETRISEDLIDIDLSELGLKLGYSQIHGTGLFADEDIFADDPIGPMNLRGMRTQLGRYTNHSDTPNAYPYVVEGGILMVAKENLVAGDEITVDYRQMIKARAEITEDKIRNAEKYLATLPQTEVEPIHLFGDGLYSRTILIPKGNWITGKVHKNSDLNIVVYGRMLVSKDGGYVEVKAPCQFVGKAGEKKIGIALEDTLWVTIHAAKSKTVDEVEEECFVKNEDEPKVLDFKSGKMLKELK